MTDFVNITVEKQANVPFDGKCVCHNVVFETLAGTSSQAEEPSRP